MSITANDWTLLVYRIPAQPTRLRLAVWRRLQKMGALYLQDAVCLLPARPDLTENMQYVAQMIEEMGGTSYLFQTAAMLPDGAAQIAAAFRALSDARLAEIAGRLQQVQATVEHAAAPYVLSAAEDDLKRERITYLRARKLAYFGSSPERESDVEARLMAVKRILDGEPPPEGGK